jgi:microcystin-dependent protein
VIRPGANVSVTGVGSATNPYVISSQGDAGQAVPSGSLVMYAGDVVPAGWLLCNGSSISRTTYAALYAAIGVAYGAGDGSTTFGIPDLRDRFPVGVSGTKARGTMAGAASYTLTMANIPSHVHSMTHDHPGFWSGSMNRNQNHNHNISGSINLYQAGIAGGIMFAQNTTNPNYSGFIDGVNLDHEHFIDVPPFYGDTGSAGQGSPTAVPTVPPYTAVNFIIKT